MRPYITISLLVIFTVTGCSQSYVVTKAVPEKSQKSAQAVTNTDSTNQYLSEGLILYRQGNLPAASDKINYVLDQEPANWLAHYYAGLMYLDNGNHGSAVRSLNKALMFGPPDGRERAMVYLAIGRNWEAQGFLGKAYQAFLTAANLDPESSAALSGLDRTASRVVKD